MSAQATGELRVDEVRVLLGGRSVLDGVSTIFRRGEVTAVIGPNGAGKSTLMSCLTGLRRPDSGKASLDGRVIVDLPHRERARRIGVLPQTPEIAWAVDVETLIGLGRIPYQGAFGGGLGADDHAAVEHAMASTGVTEFRYRVATTLSGGERSRALLARALAGEPDWLLADEPLAGLDPGHQFDACDLFRRIAAEGRGVVVTLHDLTLAARLADRIVVLAEGRVAADAAPSDALTADLLARVYGVEATVLSAPDGLSVTLLGRVRS